MAGTRAGNDRHHLNAVTLSDSSALLMPLRQEEAAISSVLHTGPPCIKAQRLPWVQRNLPKKPTSSKPPLSHPGHQTDLRDCAQ